MSESPVDRLLALWRRLERRPGGKALFSRMLGRSVPYSGSISARVIELSAGHARIEMRDRKRLRNHLRSLHAAALVNLGELATGLAFNAGMPADARGIPIRLAIEYRKKARGTITAVCDCAPPEASREQDYDIRASLIDEARDEVAVVTARWRVGTRLREPVAAAEEVPHAAAR